MTRTPFPSHLSIRPLFGLLTTPSPSLLQVVALRRAAGGATKLESVPVGWVYNEAREIREMREGARPAEGSLDEALSTTASVTASVANQASEGEVATAMVDEVTTMMAESFFARAAVVPAAREDAWLIEHDLLWCEEATKGMTAVAQGETSPPAAVDEAYQIGANHHSSLASLLDVSGINTPRLRQLQIAARRASSQASSQAIVTEMHGTPRTTLLLSGATCPHHLSARMRMHAHMPRG